ncbi:MULTISPECIES: glycosyltransferase [unclassified Coleofasciculus]|uniref:glycosyltransferase n=1 Tax=unclassified Coleofasciculus TaxID=2692782 RepID=UPI0018801031|nr:MULTISPECIES: glycosyltransferase family 2 protein [unclassified Coleofasciculus]MBE9125902.1 glycosyltransferase family 2 protein [Coleofasciculus sp. LEGE 07081]MBE9149092.1 glycosyltransferase family 2 protein [Coleofasciculus sp. LEGE 07092]
MPEPQIAAIICTHNRDTYLGAAIDSLLVQDCQDIEVVVVDNASSDRTREVVEERLPHPDLKYVYEPVIGLSVARNTGAKETTAPILAYLDDDAVASRQWLNVLVAAYKNNEKLAVAGGKVTLIWPSGIEPPSWISPELAGNLGLYDLGDRFMYINTSGLTPRGLNYSIRRTFLEQVGGFDPNLGRQGKRLLSNEELYMTELALKQGWQVAYLPDALAAHNVAPERLKPSWFLQRSWWQGISECYREEIAGQTGVSQLWRGSERMARGLYKSAKYFSQPAQRFDNLVYAYGQIGYLTTALQAMLFKRK